MLLFLSCLGVLSHDQNQRRKTATEKRAAFQPRASPDRRSMPVTLLLSREIKVWGMSLALPTHQEIPAREQVQMCL